MEELKAGRGREGGREGRGQFEREKYSGSLYVIVCPREGGKEGGRERTREGVCMSIVLDGCRVRECVNEQRR